MLCCFCCSGKNKDEKALEADESAQAVGERWKMEQTRQAGGFDANMIEGPQSGPQGSGGGATGGGPTRLVHAPVCVGRATQAVMIQVE